MGNNSNKWTKNHNYDGYDYIYFGSDYYYDSKCFSVISLKENLNPFIEHLRKCDEVRMYLESHGGQISDLRLLTYLYNKSISF